MRQVGKELGVGYVVEGSVRKDGDKIRIVSQLIDTKTGEHVWAERFDRSGIGPVGTPGRGHRNDRERYDWGEGSIEAGAVSASVGEGCDDARRV